MFCAKCGAQIQEGANFCYKCGNPIVPPPGAAEPSGVAAPAPPLRRTSGMATASLVCGIAGFFFGPVLSLLAIIFSLIAFPHFAKDANLKGKGLAVAGLVLGIIGMAWIFIIVWIILVFFGIFMF